MSTGNFAFQYATTIRLYQVTSGDKLVQDRKSGKWVRPDEVEVTTRHGAIVAIEFTGEYVTRNGRRPGGAGKDPVPGLAWYGQAYLDTVPRSHWPELLAEVRDLIEHLED